MKFEQFENLLDALAASGSAGKAIGLVVDNPEVREIYASLLEKTPELSRSLEGLLQAHALLVACFVNNHKLLLCGNGGSFADCLHISGELMKSFERERKLKAGQIERLQGLPYAELLAEKLENGLPTQVLGSNQALNSAILNDLADARLQYAQECHALGVKDDVLCGISTSGKAENVILAMSVAKAKGMAIIALVGRGGGKMSELADVAVVAPGDSTARIQEYQQILYHALCAGVEAHFFPQLKKNN